MCYDEEKKWTKKELVKLFTTRIVELKELLDTGYCDEYAVRLTLKINSKLYETLVGKKL